MGAIRRWSDMERYCGVRTCVPRLAVIIRLNVRILEEILEGFSRQICAMRMHEESSIIPATNFLRLELRTVSLLSWARRHYNWYLHSTSVSSSHFEGVELN
jgi:hypothetical protein